MTIDGEIETYSTSEEVIEAWFLVRNLSEGTQENYQIALNEFSELIGKTPKELYDEADAEEEKGIRPSKSRAYRYLLKYKKHVMEHTNAPSTRKGKISAIKSFYKAHHITLPNIKMDSGDIGLEENQSHNLSKEEIQKLADAASLRERTLIYLMAHSGMGQQEARDLTVKKYLDAAGSAIKRQLNNVEDLFKFENDVLKEILTLHITRKKKNYRYITFIPPEASRQIINYLKERCYGRNEKIRINGNNDYIFAGKYGGQLSSDSIITNFRRTGAKAGFNREDNAFSFWRSHALRGYFISTIINKRGDKIIADFMAGHKISKTDSAYWNRKPEELKKHYIKALTFLSLDGAKVKDYSSEEVRRLEEANEQQRQEIDQHKKEMDKMKLMIEDLIERMEKERSK